MKGYKEVEGVLEDIDLIDFSGNSPLMRLVIVDALTTDAEGNEEKQDRVKIGFKGIVDSSSIGNHVKYQTARSQIEGKNITSLPTRILDIDAGREYLGKFA